MILRSPSQSNNLKLHCTFPTWEKIRKVMVEMTFTSVFYFAELDHHIKLQFILLFSPLTWCTFSHVSLHLQENWNLLLYKIVYSLWFWFCYVIKKTRKKYIQIIKVIISVLWTNCWFLCLFLYFFCTVEIFYSAKHIMWKCFTRNWQISDLDLQILSQSRRFGGRVLFPRREWVKLMEIKVIFVLNPHTPGWKIFVSAKWKCYLSHLLSQRCWKRLKWQSQQVSLNFLEERMDAGQNVFYF